jgi:predicted transcriptional regulator
MTSDAIVQACCKEILKIIEDTPGITYNQLLYISKHNARTLDAAIRVLKKADRIEVFPLKGLTVMGLRLTHEQSEIA